MNLILPGRIVEEPTPPVEAEVLQHLAVKPLREQRVEGPARGGLIEEHELAGVPDEALLEMQYDNGVKEWTSVGQLKDDLRAAGGQRTADGGLRLPTQPMHLRPEAQRDFVGIGLKVVKVFGIDPIGAAAKQGARELSQMLENKLDPKPGLYRIDDLNTLPKSPVDAGAIDGDGPLLLFIHGTASSLSGSFGGMHKETSEWKNLRARYGNRIFGLQHKTLTQSPVENALELALALPRGARLHMVTHSRGGLVGELLCLQGLGPDDYDRFRARAGALDRSAELQRLKELNDELKKGEFKIERFLRVACPARGTTLASERLDRYLSVICNVIERLLPENPAFGLIKSLFLALISERANPASIPGIEAQMPDSPLIYLLNREGLKTTSDLGVIAGDIEGAGVWGHLKMWATDLFYREDHDLVVQTDSMLGGMSRAQGGRVFLDRGPKVDHFSYFKSERTRAKVQIWLTQPPGQFTDSEFQEIALVSNRSIALPPARSTISRPFVFVIPGIMGSQLFAPLRKDGAAGKEQVWMNFEALMKGGMARLKFGAKGIEASHIMPENYERLCQYLAAGHEVIEFPYDWRQSIAYSAKTLDTELKKHAAHGRPIRLLAHSMGGLVARAFIASNPALWQKLRENDGRLVMLGTPNFGSYAIPRLLFRVDETIRMLDLADPEHTDAQLSEIISGYPGVLEMLPRKDGVDFFESDWWTSSGEATAPAAGDLKAAKAFRDGLDAAPATGSIIYVAGIAPETPAGMRFSNGKAVWTSTTQGDGTVPYGLGRLDGVPTYFMEAAHGDLANHPPAFAALEELLRTGSTTLLPKEEPAAARAIGGATVMRDGTPLLFPTGPELLKTATGSRRRRTMAEPLPPLRITVSHGDVRWSRFPVLAGHYEGDTIVSAEAQLDRRLKRKLTQRFELDLYPGPVGTTEMILAPDCKPPGAIIIGLGKVGEIGSEIVRRGVAAAAMRYALEIVEEELCDGAHVWKSAALSAVLIGSGGGNALTPIEAVGAITGGILDANRMLREKKLWDRVRVDSIEIVELYEDVAVEIIGAAHEIARRHGVRGAEGQGLLVERFLRTPGGGRPRQPLNQYETGWWRRMLITGRQRDEAGQPTDDLKFVVLTDRARAEATLQCNEEKLMSGFLSGVTKSPGYDEKVALTLFELLTPNDLKRGIDRASNMVIVVDPTAARYPWEYLAHRTEKGVEPLVLKMGLIRQFETTRAKPLPRLPWGKNALVIGDTKNEHSPLPGAQVEGREVSQVLKSGGYAADPLISKDATTIVTELFARDYQIIHIAAHGIFDQLHPRHSGVVLSDGLRLNACQLEKLPSIPELVFINCCHLAQIDQSLTLESPHRFSASIAQTLIDMGVKIVVAAGWAVNDDAAKTFAQIFYEHMLGGVTFGQSVQEARQRTGNMHPMTNTWAAYQCYGNPDFRLRPHQANPAKPVRPSERIFSRGEFLAALLTIHSEAEGGLENERREELANDIRDLLQSAPPRWRDGKLLYAVGEAWMALESWPEAITAYEEAISLESTEAPVRAIEQLANAEDRYATKLINSPALAATAGVRPTELRTRAVQRLENLLKLGETSERHSLLGGFFKRQGQISTSNKERRDRFLKARQHYKKAHELALKRTGLINPYPAGNWLNFAALLQDEKIDDALLEQIQTAARDRAKDADNFWNRVGPADVLLATHLVKGTLVAEVDQVKKAYESVLEAGADAGKLNSLSAHIDFLIDSFKLLHPAEKHILDALGKLRFLFSSPPDTATPAPAAPSKKTRQRVRHPTAKPKKPKGKI